MEIKSSGEKAQCGNDDIILKGNKLILAVPKHFERVDDLITRLSSLLLF